MRARGHPSRRRFAAPQDEEPSSVNRRAVGADQADVLNWPEVNDRSKHLSGFVMRSVLRAIWIIASAVLAVSSAQAQLTPPSTAGSRPKPATTVPIRPALQKPEDTANAMAQAERLGLQSDLAWVGQYNGAITGDVSERMVNAIKEFQKARGGRETGVLNSQERGVLADTAKRRQENVGWKIVNDAGTGVRLGIPAKLTPQQSSA